MSSAPRQLLGIGDGVWLADGDVVDFYGFP